MMMSSPCLPVSPPDGRKRRRRGSVPRCLESWLDLPEHPQWLPTFRFTILALFGGLSLLMASIGGRDGTSPGAHRVRYPTAAPCSLACFYLRRSRSCCSSRSFGGLPDAPLLCLAARCSGSGPEGHPRRGVEPGRVGAPCSIWRSTPEYVGVRPTEEAQKILKGALNKLRTRRCRVCAGRSPG